MTVGSAGGMVLVFHPFIGWTQYASPGTRLKQSESMDGLMRYNKSRAMELLREMREHVSPLRATYQVPQFSVEPNAVGAGGAIVESA